jgi:hypothetical protein
LNQLLYFYHTTIFAKTLLHKGRGNGAGERIKQKKESPTYIQIGLRDWHRKLIQTANYLNRAGSGNRNAFADHLAEVISVDRQSDKHREGAGLEEEG